MKVNQLKMGVILSYSQMVLGIIIGIIQAPIVIRCLGQSEYGLYNTVVSTLSMLSVLSLGFNSSYIRYYSRYKRENDTEAIYKLNGLFLLIFTVIGLIALGCGIFLTYNLELVFADGLTSGEYEIAKVLMWILTINLAFTFPMSVFQNIISANEKFVFLKLLGMIRTVLSPLLIIPIVLVGHKSIALASVTVAINLFVDVLFLIYVLFGLKQRFIFRDFEEGLLRSLFGFTAFIAINLIVDEINSNVDKVLLSRYQGTASAAVYSVGYTLYNFYRQFSTSVSGVFAPRVHRIYNNYKSDSLAQKVQLTGLFTRVGRIQFLILGLAASGFVFFGKPFIHFWAGEGYQNAYYVGLLLILPSTIALIQNIGLEIQRAENKHKFRSIAYLIMAIVNVVLTIFLCQIYGEIGAAFGTALSLVLANGIIMNVYYHKACNINIVAFWKQILRLSCGIIAPVLVGIGIVLFIDLYTIWQLLLWMVVYSIVYCASMWLFGMNEYERELIKKPIRRMLKKND